MSTKNPRLNITFEDVTLNLLTQLTAHEHKSTASLARELIIEALDRREDMSLSTLAESREAFNQAKYVSHKDAWK
jgi:hypothetical protein